MSSKEENTTGKRKNIYVSFPYSSVELDEREHRLSEAKVYGRHLAMNHCNPISAAFLTTPKAWEADCQIDIPSWHQMSRDLLEVCEETHVVLVHGWEKSTGVKLEIEHSEFLKIPVRYFLITSGEKGQPPRFIEVEKPNTALPHFELHNYKRIEESVVA